MNGKFQSTLPAWGATMGVWILNSAFGFQSTLPAWGATIFRIGAVTTCIHFNPRSPHGERHSLLACQRMNTGISIHAPRMGSDNKHSHSNCFTCIFQSTLPAWGATLLIDTTLFRKDNFNPRSPHGERPHRPLLSQRVHPIFQSTLPAWGATLMGRAMQMGKGISIHAPRMGSDLARLTLHKKPQIFQSTLPAWGATLSRLFPCFA